MKHNVFVHVRPSRASSPWPKKTADRNANHEGGLNFHRGLKSGPQEPPKGPSGAQETPETNLKGLHRGPPIYKTPISERELHVILFGTPWREIKYKTSAPLELGQLDLANMTPNPLFHYGF